MKAYKPRRKRKRAGILSPKERVQRKRNQRKNRVKTRLKNKQYYRKNKSRLKQRQRRGSKIKITGPKKKANVKYTYS